MLSGDEFGDERDVLVSLNRKLVGMSRRSFARIIVSALLFVIGPLLTVTPCAGSGQDFPLSPPKVLSSPLFPCSTCHGGMEPNPKKRELSFHPEIVIRGHGEPKRWCLDCHDAGTRDRLRLINGEQVDFAVSYLLCGQCHGIIVRDWKAGIHGKRTGKWDGPRQYFLCTSCHNPHSPRFESLAPEAVPLRPGETLRR